MISHIEAQALISSRLDAPLDPIAERELEAHLATCQQCRAFANQAVAMTRALHELPYLPASPTVRRAVLERIQKPPSPWARLQTITTPNLGPALSTIAAVIIVAILSVVVLTRIVGQSGGNGDNHQTRVLTAPTSGVTEQSQVAQTQPTATAVPPTANAQQPTLPPTTESAALVPTQAPPTTAPTQAPPTTAPPTSAPTEVPPTEVPTQVPPTKAAPPTATNTTAQDAAVPQGGNGQRHSQTATKAPTETPIPTPTPTNAPVPTDTPHPTVTPAPTATTVPTDVPTDVPTETPAPTSTAVPTEIPTVTPAPTEVPPTETPIPTEIPPTETPIPTDTPAPTSMPTETQVVQSAPTQAQQSIDAAPGTTPIPAVGANQGQGSTQQPTETPGSNPIAPTQESFVENDSTPTTAQNQVTVVPTADAVSGDGTGSIEPADGSTAIPAGDQQTGQPQPTETTNQGAVPTATPENTGGDNQKIIESNNPGGSQPTATEQSSPEAAGGTTPTSTSTQNSTSGTDGDLSSASVDDSVAPIQPGDRLYLDESQNVFGSSVDPSDASTSTSASGKDIQWPKDETGTVVGWRDGVVFFTRPDDQGQVSYYIADVNGGGKPSNEQNLGTGDSTWQPTGAPAYRYQDGIVVQTAGGWVVATPEGARFTPSQHPGEALTTVRVDGAVSPSGFIAFQTSQGIEIDYLDPNAPGSVVLPVGNVVDFDISGDGSQAVVSTGDGIEIWSIGSQQSVSRYANSQGIPVGSVLWYGDTIYFVDSQSNTVKTIGVPSGGQ